MRCFIAIDLDPSLVAKIKEIQDRLRSPDINHVKESNLHFTLKFLGEIDDEKAENVKKELTELAGVTPAFEISLHGIGVFPNEKFIRVVWVGAESEEFQELHESANDALSKFFKKEKPSPHLTIARVRSGKDNQKILDFVKANKGTEIGAMMVDKIRLKKSTLTKEGPVYEDLAVFELG